MALEIERKFLVRVIPDLAPKATFCITQGYILDLFGVVVRIRKSNRDGFITIKRDTGTNSLGVHEYEYSIPEWVASFLLRFSFLGKIEKIRKNILFKGHMFELDIFQGHNAGLAIVEVELEDENEVVDLPYWVGEEVTGKQQYFNKNLAKRK